MKGYMMIWTKHGKGSSASCAIGNPDNTVVQGPNMELEGPNEAIERQHHCPQMDHVIKVVMKMTITMSTIKNKCGVLCSIVVVLLEVLIIHCERYALNTTTKKHLYQESKGCTKEWMVLRFILRLLTLKA